MYRVVATVVLALASATAPQPDGEQSDRMEAKSICINGELRGLIIEVPRPGVWSIRWDENPCPKQEIQRRKDV